MTRDGRIPIKIEAFKNDFLKNIVLIDTPGAGDTKNLDDIVKDLLPICDLIYYLFPSINLFDITDIPILTLKEKYLSDIEIRFLVTRADQFKEKFSEPTSDGNLKIIEVNSVLAETASRINSSLNTNKFSRDNFLMIDNIDGYNIEKLKKEILSFIDPTQLENRIRLHTHKITYFLDTSRNIQSFFTSEIENKLSTLNDFVKQAKANKEEFQKAVAVGKQNFLVQWSGSYDKITDEISKLQNRIEQYREKLDLPQNIFEIPEFNTWKNTKKEEMSAKANEEANRIINDLFFNIKQQVQEKVSIFKADYVNTAEFKNPIEIYKDIRINPEIDLPGISYPRFMLENPIVNVNEFIYKEINKIFSDKRNNINTIQKFIESEYPIEHIQEIIDETKSQIIKEFNTFFQLVNNYRLAA